MKMSSKLCILLVFVLSILVLASCHGSKERASFEVPDSFDESKSYEIVFWAKNENNATQRQVYADAVAAFEALHPNIKVTLRNFTDYGEIYNNVITRSFNIFFYTFTNQFKSINLFYFHRYNN